MVILLCTTYILVMETTPQQESVLIWVLLVLLSSKTSRINLRKIYVDLEAMPHILDKESKLKWIFYCFYFTGFYDFLWIKTCLHKFSFYLISNPFHFCDLIKGWTGEPITREKKKVFNDVLNYSTLLLILCLSEKHSLLWTRL